MTLNASGMIVASIWQELPLLFRSVEIDEFVVMPDHFHGILHLKPAFIGNQVSYKPLGQVVGALKMMSAKRINEDLHQAGVEFWQRGFYDRIIRDPKIEDRVRAYIRNNPAVLFRRISAHARDYGRGGSRPAPTIIPGSRKGDQ